MATTAATGALRSSVAGQATEPRGSDGGYWERNVWVEF
jgi:hypothetical protein